MRARYYREKSARADDISDEKESKRKDKFFIARNNVKLL